MVELAAGKESSLSSLVRDKSKEMFCSSPQSCSALCLCPRCVFSPFCVVVSKSHRLHLKLDSTTVGDIVTDAVEGGEAIITGAVATGSEGEDSDTGAMAVVRAAW